MRTKSMRLASLLVGTSSLIACGGGEGGDPDDEPVNCALETRDDDFVIGLSKVGEGETLGFTLMNAEPAPPIRGDNTWTIQIREMSSGAIGAPVDGASLFVTPFMPDHGHPAAKDVTIEPTGVEGEYELTPINLWMPGMWETTIEVESASGNDEVVLRFCIPS